MGNSIDEQCTLLDDKVSANLHMCTTLADTISPLEESIYTEAAKIFGHLQPKMRNLAEQSRQTKLSIQFIQQKNLLSALIKSTSLPEQQVALTQLLINIKCKIISICKAEKARKQC